MSDRIVDFNELKNKARDKDIDKFESYIYDLYYSVAQGKMSMMELSREITKYMNENNINGKIAFLRDTFLKAEKDYLEELIKKPKYKNFIEDLNKYNSKELSLEAVKRISAIESGKVKEEDLEKVETEITLLLASIQDCIREKVKEKIKEKDEELEL